MTREKEVLNLFQTLQEVKLNIMYMFKTLISVIFFFFCNFPPINIK